MKHKALKIVSAALCAVLLCGSVVGVLALGGEKSSSEQEEIQKLADEKKKIDSQFENLKELYKEDDFVKQIGKLSSNDEEVSAQKIDELLETYIAHTEKKKQGIEKIQNEQ